MIHRSLADLDQVSISDLQPMVSSGKFTTAQREIVDGEALLKSESSNSIRVDSEMTENQLTAIHSMELYIIPQAISQLI